jgi:nicotinate-nucleotide adenylyltransferase
VALTGLFGGAFDPPHVGHLALVEAAERRFRPERVIVLVVGDPGHKEVELDAATRLQLARAAFPDRRVELDHHSRTVDMLRERRFEEPLFLIGADEFCDFLSWKEPQAVLALARLGVATRPGFPRERLESVLAALERPDRVEFFEIDPIPASSTDIRARVRDGRPIHGLVPEPVAELISELGLYRPAGYTEVGSAQGDGTA